MSDLETMQNTNKIELYLKIASYLALIAGLSIGLLTLGSAAGIWIGVWDFRRGFDLLRIANNYGDLVAIVCLVIAIGLLILGQLLATKNSLKLSGIALIGTLSAGLGYYIPEGFRPPEGVNYPPIHDISTNTSSPPLYVDVLPLRSDAPNTVEYGGSPNMTAERLAELTKEAYPDLTTQRYNASVDEVFARALSAVNSLGWELVAQTPQEGRIEATATTFWYRFKDDVVIDIRQEGRQTLVDARSLSRVGGGDVGANALRLRAFFALL
jgi:uncharacterized protein (DUF1499 family)